MKQKINNTKNTQLLESQAVKYKKTTFLGEYALSVNFKGKLLGYIKKCDVLNEYSFFDINGKFLNGGLNLKECKEILVKFTLPEIAITKDELFKQYAPNFNFELDKDQLLHEALKRGFVVQFSKNKFLINNEY